MKKKKCIIVDIDNTVCEELFVGSLPTDNSRESWNKFHEQRHYYTPELYLPIKQIIRLIESYCEDNDVEVIFLTAREDIKEIRENTEYFIKNNFSFLDNYKLYMRGNNDFSPSSWVKEGILVTQILPHYDVVFALDDEENNVNMYVMNNILCLKVCKRERSFLCEEK